MLNKKKVEIAMICDAGFMMPTTVALKSLQINRNKDVLYVIHIYTYLCAESEISILKQLEQENFEIDVNRLDESAERNSYVNENISATTTALYKFDLSQLLNCDKVLYLDGDIIIQKDLYALYSTGIDEYYGAVVKDMPLMVAQEPQMKKLGQFRKEYFNSGVMLLNLKKLRQNEMDRKLYEYKAYGKNIFMDQDAFNVVFGGKVKYLSFYNNLVFRVAENFYLEEICEFYHIPIVKDLNELYQNAVILHLASPFKPWKYETPYLSDLFKAYYYKTEYAVNEIALKERVESKKEVRNIENNLEKNETERILFLSSTRYELYVCYLIRILLIPDNIKCYLILEKDNERYINNEELKSMFHILSNENFAIDTDYSYLYFNGIRDLGYEIFYRQVKKRKLLKVKIFESDIYSYSVDFKKQDLQYIQKKHLNVKENEMLSWCTETSYFHYRQLVNKSKLVGVVLPISERFMDDRKMNGIEKVFHEQVKEKLIFIPFVEENERLSAIEIDLFCKIAENIGKENVVVISDDNNLRNMFWNFGYKVSEYDECIYRKEARDKILVTNHPICAANLQIHNFQNYKIVDFSHVIKRAKKSNNKELENMANRMCSLRLVYRPENRNQLLEIISFYFFRDKHIGGSGED